MSRIAVATMFVHAVAVVALAQEAQPQPTPAPAAALPRFAESVQVTVGNVDVTVIDKAGLPVGGLTPADFILTVDGQATEISNFGLYERALSVVGAAPAAPAATSRVGAEPAQAPRQPHVLVIFVDNSNSQIFNRNNLLKRVHEFIQDYLKPPDRAAVVVYERKLRFLTPLTPDVGEVRQALEKMLSSAGNVGEAFAFRRIAENQIREISEDNQPVELKIDRAMASARVNARQIETWLQRTVNAFKTLIRTLSGVPGKKSILYVSDGLPMSPGIEIHYLINELFATRMGETEFGAINAADLYQGLAAFAAAADVTLYTIDARGLDLPSGREAEHRFGLGDDVAAVTLHNYQEPLKYMAAATGGLAVVNTNEFELALAKIGEAMESYYSIGFRLEAAQADRHHAVQVALKDRPEYRLRYRATFVERTLATRVADRTVAGLAFDLDENPLGIAVEAGQPQPAGKGSWNLPITVRVPLAKLALVPQGGEYVGAVSMYYAAGDDEGKRSELAHERTSVRVPAAQYGRVKALTIQTSVGLGPGVYRVSVGVLDEASGDAGFAVARKEIK